MRRVYLVISLILLSSIACSFLSTATPTNTPTRTATEAAATQVPSVTSAPAATATQSPVVEATSPTTPEEPTRTPYPTSVLDTQMSQEISLIQSQVIEDRGLQPDNPVPVVLLSPEELRQNVTDDFLVDYTDEEMADDQIELGAIGLLDPGFDLKAFYTELLSEQVAGYYDNDVGEMFVVKGEGFEGPEHLTYAHEFTHVLQDQTYDIENGLNYSDETCEVDTERCAAIQALIEGDATLSEFNWFQYYAPTEDQQEIIEYISSMNSPIYDSAPAFMQDDFVFAYNQGLEFVQSFYDEGGWPAVDVIYKNPPVSTEQILHPELYPAGTPIPVDLPDLTPTLGDGWRELSRNQMGEWYTYLILGRAANPAAQLDDETAKAAAAGWGGDEYTVYRNDTTGETVFVMQTIWDSASEADEFAEAFQEYADARFGVSASQEGDNFTWEYAEGFSSFTQSGDMTTWISAPDSATAQSVADQLQQ